MRKAENKDIKHHSQQSSKTLMRHAVPKPRRAGEKKRLPTKDASLAVVPKLSIRAVESHRAELANQIARSERVKHFERTYANSYTTPAAEPVVVRRPISVPKFEQPVSNTTRMLEQAIARAESQPFQTKHKKRLSKHVTGTLLALAAIVIMCGVLIGQNKPQLALEAARAKAGFAATIPTYQPAGFSLGKLKYSAGNFVADFVSNSDNRHFSVVEKPLKNLGVSIGSYSRALHNGNLTVYIDNNHNAMWSSDNILYTIKADGALGDQQLLQLASSM